MRRLKEIGWRLLLGLPILLFACGGEDDPTKEGDELPETLSTSSFIFTRQSGELKSYLELSGLDVSQEVIQYNVKMYEVEYQTFYKGEEITASGLIFLPETNQALGTISFQHGTISADRQAPSQQAINSPELILYAALASTGLVTVVPDYIGFGASAGIVHPYYVEEPTAAAVIDMIYASGNLVSQEGMTNTPDLFLAGYSQGGYATMAAHKYIEAQGIQHFDLRASFPAAGGYEMIGVRNFFFSQDVYHEPFYLAFVAMGFKTANDWEEPLSLLFREPYATGIPGYFNGEFSGSQINAMLTDTVEQLVNPGYLADPDDPAFTFITEAFQENSLTDWVPSIPMHMYHGDMDITVPYQNSVEVYAHFIASGASPATVSFTSLEGGTHTTGLTPYIELFIPELMEYLE